MIIKKKKEKGKNRVQKRLRLYSIFIIDIVPLLTVHIIRKYKNFLVKEKDESLSSALEYEIPCQQLKQKLDRTKIVKGTEAVPLFRAGGQEGIATVSINGREGTMTERERERDFSPSGGN